MMMSLTVSKQFPRGVFGEYVSMEIPGYHLWLCYKHDSSSTRHLSWYTDRTVMRGSRYKHSALRHLLLFDCIAVEAIKRCKDCLFLKWLQIGLYMDWRGI